MASKKILLTGIPNFIRRDILFQSAVHWAEEGFKVLYLKKSKFESIPSTGHGPQIPSSEVLSKIRILYLESMEEAFNSIVDVVTFRDTVPRVILVEELEEYQTQDSSRDCDHQLARICATLSYVVSSCAIYCGQPTYLLVSLATPVEKIPPVIVTMFDFVWTFDCDSCSLLRILPVDDISKIKLSLGRRTYDEAFVLKAISSLFVGD